MPFMMITVNYSPKEDHFPHVCWFLDTSNTKYPSGHHIVYTSMGPYCILWTSGSLTLRVES